MAINVGFPFKRTSAAPIDESLVLTKAQMVAADDTMMPSNYFCVCKDDGKLYLYAKSNPVDETTGKYRRFAAGGEDKFFFMHLDLQDFDQKLPYSDDTAYYVLPDEYSKAKMAEQIAAGKRIVAMVKGFNGTTAEDGEFLPIHYVGNDTYDAQLFYLEYPQRTVSVLQLGIRQEKIDGQDKWIATADLEASQSKEQVYVFDVDSDKFTEDPNNPDGKHFGAFIDSPTPNEVIAKIKSGVVVYVRLLYNTSQPTPSYQFIPLDSNGSDVRARYLDVNLPQKNIVFADVYMQRRTVDGSEKTYFGTYQDEAAGGGGGADFQIAHIPSGGGTGEEVKAILLKGDDSLSVDYYKNAELPDSVNLSVGDDAFIVPTTEYVDKKTGVFVLDADNPCSYNALQAAINAPKSVFVKFGGKFYPLVDKWENDEGSKRYVNLATLQRPTADKGVTFFFFEALLADLESPMAYSSNYEQPYGKGYVDSKIGDLTTLTTNNKDNLVAALNEVYEKSGEPFRVKQWASNALNVEIPVCTEDLGNGSIPKMVFSIDAVEGADYQIVGMIAYELFDEASGGSRINCWPVCQFTGNGQKELSVRWMCAGTTRKTAKRISAWVLLKHR